MSKDIVISQPWGGLGDNLQFSTLPRLYAAAGYNVYISDTNALRNKEIYDLVWGLNPYVKGLSSQPPNAGSCKGPFVDVSRHFIKNVELSHGLFGGDEGKYPELYYTPKHIPAYANTLIFDPSFVSTQIDSRAVRAQFKAVFAKYADLQIKKIVFSNIAASTDIFPEYTDTIVIDNIYQYCDVMRSCKVVCCVFSGQSVLASAIKRDNKDGPEIYCVHSHAGMCHNPWTYTYRFDNINYIYAYAA